MSLYDYSINRLDGTALNLGDFAGQTVLLVNVASKCGLTPQYTGLEELHKTYGTQGFTVLGVPCNQFLGQEPGTAEEIQEFCSTTYGVTFPLTEKVDVNGDERHALYAELSAIVDDADAEGYSGDIRWNFEKFLIGANGEVIRRYNPSVEPTDPRLIADITAALA
jgi:glutathione peroxidase